jgi:hypothetical protein
LSLRISRRTSAGRGEYEISENYDGISPRDLDDRRLSVRLGPGLVLDTGIVLRLKNGKRRLRRDDGIAMQFPRQMCAILLMPHAVRTREGLGEGQPVLRADEYSIEHLELASATLRGVGGAELDIESVIYGNFAYQNEQLSFAERFAQVQRLWANRTALPQRLSDLLGEHEALVLSGQPIPPRGEEVVEELQGALTEMSNDFGLSYRTAAMDAVPDLLRALEWARVPPQPPIQVTDVPPDQPEIRRRTIGEWRRWANARGAASARFRQDVREAYGWTCLVCGVHFPATEANRIPGVDAAHTLPWSDYDLDCVSNGLCLCRQHHWAFDQNLLVIRCENGRYFIEVPDEAQRILLEDYPEFSLDELLRHVGEIPLERLPGDPADRPHPEFLRRLYESQ